MNQGLPGVHEFKNDIEIPYLNPKFADTRYTVPLGHRVRGHRVQNGRFAKSFGGVIEDTGDFGKSFGGGHRVHFFRIVVFTEMHIKKLLLRHDTFIRPTFRVLVSPYLILLT